MSSRGRNFNLRTDVGNNFPSVHHLPNQPLRFFWKILRNFGKYWERFGNSLPLVNHLPVCLGIILNLSNQSNCSFENRIHSDNPWTVFPASRPVSFVCASRKMTVNLALHQARHKSLQPGQRQRPISAQYKPSQPHQKSQKNTECKSHPAKISPSLNQTQPFSNEFKSHPTLHPLGLDQTHSKEMSVYYTQCLHEVDQCAFVRLTFDCKSHSIPVLVRLVRSQRRGDST